MSDSHAAQSRRSDPIAGFLVFLIALPLCLAIARASNYPPIAGIWTAVIGALVCTFVSNSQLTIKGPAAGLIVIVAGAVTDFAREHGGGLSEADAMALGYRMALGVGVVAGAVQVLFGLARAGKFGDVFPLTAVHGMLASIGVLIIAKQAYAVLGVDAPKGATPLQLLTSLPGAVPALNPAIAGIGLVSLGILFGLPLVPFRWVKRVPAPLLVLLVAVPLGMAFGLDHAHPYTFPGYSSGEPVPSTFEVGPRFLVDVPAVLKSPTVAFALPNFRGVRTPTGLKYIVLFALVGSLESLLSARAIDLLDPRRRKTNFDRELLAVGLANAIASAVGALPMIAEIVRSKANIDSGAKTKFANFYHGLFLLGFVLLAPGLIHRIPLAALGAMLVYTGFRLASPREFVRSWKVGRAQFVVFVGTILVTLTNDLLVGIAAGVAIELVFVWWHGAPLARLLRPEVESYRRKAGTVVVLVREAAVFSNWLGLKARIQKLDEGQGVVIDLSETWLVDHSVMEKLHELEREFADRGKRIEVVGLSDHAPFSAHPRAARKKAG